MVYQSHLFIIAGGLISLKSLNIKRKGFLQIRRIGLENNFPNTMSSGPNIRLPRLADRRHCCQLCRTHFEGFHLLRTHLIIPDCWLSDDVNEAVESYAAR